MSDTVKMRGAPRHRFHAAVRLRVEGEEHAAAYTGDLSEGGMFVRMPRPPAMGAEVEVEVLGHGAPLALRGRVVHVIDQESAHAIDRAAGVGVRFAELEPASQARLAALLDEARAVSAAGSSRLPDLNSRAERVRALCSERDRLRAADAREVLGVPDPVDPPSLRRAYLMQLQRWHPSAFMSEPTEVRSVAAEIYDLVEAAHDQLVDGARQTVLRRRTTPPTGTSVTAVPSAEIHVQPSQKAAVVLAERLAYQRRYVDARKVLRGALEHEPSNWALRELYSLVSGYAALEEAQLDEAIPHFEEALRLNPASARAIEELRKINARRRRSARATGED